MAKLDLRAEYPGLYAMPRGQVLEVNPPEFKRLAVDGMGDPNTSRFYQEALEALYAVAYTLKFNFKKTREFDWAVMPLEGLWWSDNPEVDFLLGNKNVWRWTAYIVQPGRVTEADYQEALAEVKAKKDPPALPLMRFDKFDEGRSLQILHVGPYAAEKPAIERLHRQIQESNLVFNGRHHEIYLGDPRRSAPENLKTIIRQPVKAATR
jgi:hypothetical protein